MTADVPALVAFLRVRLNEDERKITAMEREESRVQTAPIFQGHPPNWLAGVDIFVSSKRWRAEVEAKRRLLECLVGATGTGTSRLVANDEPWAIGGDYLVKTLALPYASHPEYREEWRP
ncbi:hypothetical protein GCM10010112_67700 [Actinoplanes lobatus]|uniref:Uncharacterized protein n=1 Tax=Actinoplanes lobatus TaxID=113568 RepID=A0A7W7HER9_9ACTN|nr:DUF6221 family protein [Actinoplanes lobatus]MBB4749150.1 hypothetical protein [Actinoplanes lobatus]GGN86307.1 hypothetical protein GCM10010112_67700 [Actinoplanes lobatus]GIE42752.1 hypothetical protein Alo02nite_56500 [Actinoplanes lobatus]